MTLLESLLIRAHLPSSTSRQNVQVCGSLARHRRFALSARAGRELADSSLFLTIQDTAPDVYETADTPGELARDVCAFPSVPLQRHPQTRTRSITHCWLAYFSTNPTRTRSCPWVPTTQQAPTAKTSTLTVSTSMAQNRHLRERSSMA
jgi:hypothetical protein